MLGVSSKPPNQTRRIRECMDNGYGKLQFTPLGLAHVQITPSHFETNTLNPMACGPKGTLDSIKGR